MLYVPSDLKFGCNSVYHGVCYSSRCGGFMLVSEMVTILILAITLIGLAQINRITLTGSNQMIYSIHANWMVEDIFTRMRVNEAGRIANAYSVSNVTCPGLNQSFDMNNVAQRDLQKVFCSPNLQGGGNQNVFWGSAGHIAGLAWSIECVNAASPTNCPADSPIRLEISWPNRLSQSVMGDGRERIVRERSFE